MNLLKLTCYTRDAQLHSGRQADRQGRNLFEGMPRDKMCSGGAFFGNWLRQADKIPGVTCRVVKQMN